MRPMTDFNLSLYYIVGKEFSELKFTFYHKKNTK